MMKIPIPSDLKMMKMVNVMMMKKDLLLIKPAVPLKKVVLDTPITAKNALKFMTENSYSTKMMMMKNLMMKMIPMTKKKMMMIPLAPPPLLPVLLVLMKVKVILLLLLVVKIPLKAITIMKVQEILIVVAMKIMLLMKVKLKLWLTKTAKLMNPTVPKFMVETKIGIMNKVALKEEKVVQDIISMVLLKTGPHTNTTFSLF